MDVNISPYQLKWKGTPQKMDWGVKTLKVFDVWKETQGEDVNIAILDTGIVEHEDLKSNVKGGINFTTSNRDDFVDRQGHGTHVAGITGAIDNKIGVIGVAPKVNIYSVKVLGDNGSGSFEWIAKGIDWCIDNKMEIISMSLGSNYPSQEMHDAIKRAYEKNITIVAAAGNDGDEYEDNDIDYPARYDEVIAVGAINKYLKRGWFSSDGKELEIAAPGVDILSTYLNNEYAILSGTSMAAPFVTGVLALLISKHKKNEDKNQTPINTPEKIREHLKRTADDAGEIGKDNFYGYGIISPTKLLKGVDVSSLYLT